MEKNLVFNHNGVLVTSSRKVADDFEKEHKNVMRDIRGYVDFLISSKLSVSKYFIENLYKDSMNREQSEFLLTKNGFSLVAMGFTGDKALMWKVEYINEFDYLATELKNLEENKNKEYLDFITELYGEVFSLTSALEIINSLYPSCNIITTDELLDRYRAERWIIDDRISTVGLKGLYLVVIDNTIYASQKALNKIARKCFNDNTRSTYENAKLDDISDKEISFRIKNQ